MTPASSDDIDDSDLFDDRDDVGDITSFLPTFTAIINVPGASTTELLAQIAGLSQPDPVVFVDPNGRGTTLVAAHDESARTILVPGPGRYDEQSVTALLQRAQDAIANAPADATVLIDEGPHLTRNAAARALIDHLIRSARDASRRVVLSIEAPDDLAGLPEPELWCVFDGGGPHAERWRHARHALAAAGAFDRHDADQHALERCAVVAAPGALLIAGELSGDPEIVANDPERATLIGVLEVGPEPDTTGW